MNQMILPSSIHIRPAEPDTSRLAERTARLFRQEVSRRHTR